MRYLEKWIKHLASQSSLTIDGQIEVEGICKRHLGPRLEYAVIRLLIESSNALDVQFSEDLLVLDDDSKELLDAAIYGVLNVIMVTKQFPLRNIKITCLSADIHPIDSNKAAFIKAGMDAGQKILDSIG